MAQPGVRESLLTRRNPSKRLPLNICIPGYEPSASLYGPDKSGRNLPTREAITESTHSTAPTTSPYRKGESQEPHSPYQPISDQLSTRIRNIASLQAHFAFTTQGKSTITDKGMSRSSLSISSAMNPEALIR